MGVWSRMPGNYVDDSHDKCKGVYLTTAYLHEGLLVMDMKELGGDTLCLVLSGSRVIGATQYKGDMPKLSKLVDQAVKEFVEAGEVQ